MCVCQFQVLRVKNGFSKVQVVVDNCGNLGSSLEGYVCFPEMCSILAVHSMSLLVFLDWDSE